LEHFLRALVFADDALGAPHAEDVYARLEAVVSASPPGSNGVLFLPWLNGSVAPVNDGAMRGGFLNVSLDTARSDLARAVLEGISYQYRLLADAARSLVRGDFDHFTLHGGGALSETWSQTIADMLGAPVHALAEPRLINCRGLGLLAFQRLGRIDYDTVASRVAVDRVYEPKPALVSLYADRRDAMAMAFKKNRGLFRKLNGPSKGSQVDIETASEQEHV
jgi:xylulokinase